MSKVLVLGASGFLGSAIAKKFADAGYQVYGLTRSADKGKVLAQNEITPVIGTAQDFSSWEKYALLADIIVESIADYQDYSTAGTVAKHLTTLLSSHKNKLVIYTSGVWLYGDTTGKSSFDEGTPVNPPTIVKYRPAIEKLYLDSGAVVLRPGMLYGHAGSIFASIFQSLTDGKAQFAGNGDNYWACTHVDDAAEAYLSAAKHPSESRGQIFNVVSQNERVPDIIKAAARVVGYKGEIAYFAPQDPFTEALGLNQKGLSTKIIKQLGWAPKKTSFIDGVETYYATWKGFH